ncbi:MAG: hypothetical protein WC570_04300 [Patescibacteria group bacterium]
MTKPNHTSNCIKQLMTDINQIKPLQKFLIKFLKHKFIYRSRPISPQIYIVGGAVRDALLGHQLADYDFVVEGLTKKQLANYLDQTDGQSLDIASRNFGVFKYKLPYSKTVIDIALPRQDIYLQHGLGHKDVQTHTKAKLSIKDDLARRDFTINAMAVNIATHELIDYFHGLVDLQKKVIRCVGDPYERLVLEDPTRIMRALRFAATFNFSIAPPTLAIIKEHHHEINQQFKQRYQNKQKKVRIRNTERVSREILALEFLKGFDRQPVRYIELIDQCQIYKTIFPAEIVPIWEKLKSTSQPPDKHAEGSVWNHGLLALKNLDLLKENQLGLSPHASINLKLATLFHDIGKVTTLKIDATGKYTYYNHPDESAAMATKIIRHLHLPAAVGKNESLSVSVKKVVFLIKHHMLPSSSYADQMRDKTVVKYFLEDEPLGQELLQLAFIDASSSLKQRGPQDYTGIKKTLKKIEIAREKLAQITHHQKIYPVDGQKIKKLLTTVVKSLKKQLSEDRYQQIYQIATSHHGGQLIGQLKEIILEDALAHPRQYNTISKKNTRAKKIIMQAIEK